MAGQKEHIESSEKCLKLDDTRIKCECVRRYEFVPQNVRIESDLREHEPNVAEILREYHEQKRLLKEKDQTLSLLKTENQTLKSQIRELKLGTASQNTGSDAAKQKCLNSDSGEENQIVTSRIDSKPFPGDNQKKLQLLTVSKSVSRADIVATQEKEIQYLIDIFPAELWDLIFDQVENCSFLENWWKASLGFRELLDPRRAVFLFPKVWEILGPKYQKSNHPAFKDSTGNSTLLACFCGRQRIAQWFSVILKMRLVCRTWSKSIDIFCSNLKFTCMLTKFEKKKSLDRFLVNWIFPSSKVFQCVQHFHETHPGKGAPSDRPPFVGRKVALYYSSAMLNQPGAQAIWDIFSAYGHHVMHLALVDGVDDFTEGRYQTIRRLLEYCPRLETLELRLCKIRPLYLRHMLEYMSISPLPTIPSLQHLTITGMECPVTENILRYNSQISKLEVVISSVNGKTLSRYLLHPINLRELSLRIYKPCDLIQSPRQHCTWPLQKLSLNGCDSLCSWSEIFRVVMIWKDTLTDLYLTLPYPRCRPEICGGIFNLQPEHIQRLKLRMPMYHTLDFILGLQDTLKSLEIEIPYLENEKDKKYFAANADINRKIQLLSCIEKPFESNIWNLFPTLECFHLTEYLAMGQYAQNLMRLKMTKSQWHNERRKNQ